MTKLLILQAFTCLSLCLAQTKSAEAPLSVLNEMKPKTIHSEYPNIVLIYADDLGYGDLSSYGATKIKTPNIDRLAERGILFTAEHSTSATCTPSRYVQMKTEKLYFHPYLIQSS